jgi:hypothetical protein
MFEHGGKSECPVAGILIEDKFEIGRGRRAQK